MSGGVDSSTAALLLSDQGYEVIGVMMRLWSESDADGPVRNRCCSPEAVDNARQVADQLGIRFYLVDHTRSFKELVVDYFVREYAEGRTPNPCLMCNRHIKFGRLLTQARSLGAEYLATGHYARIRRTKGHSQLLRGCDARKDQSYALYMLGQMELAHTVFPIGGYDKDEVRSMAAERMLDVADRPESQDLCFLADGDYRRFLREHAPHVLCPGPVVNRDGRVLGKHEGLAFYTVGQRRGLGIRAAHPLYVLALDAERNTLVVGSADQLGQCELVAEDVSYVSGEPPQEPMEVTAKIRYQAHEAPAYWIPLDSERARVAFSRPQRDVTPGQGVVAYQGEVLVGGGIIA
jgi:tRNA-specific 2-thiouridylase